MWRAMFPAFSVSSVRLSCATDRVNSSTWIVVITKKLDMMMALMLTKYLENTLLNISVAPKAQLCGCGSRTSNL